MDDWLDHLLGGDMDPDDLPDSPPDPPMGVTGWNWTAESLMMGEYVGYELYLQLRSRLSDLGVPTQAHDVLIQDLIDTHDASALTDQGACATLAIWDVSGLTQPMAIWDATEYPAIDQID